MQRYERILNNKQIIRDINTILTHIVLILTYNILFSLLSIDILDIMDCRQTGFSILCEGSVKKMMDMTAAAHLTSLDYDINMTSEINNEI